jgi:hypothetical protein
MSINHFKKLVRENLDRMGVKIENRNPQHPQIESPRGLFDRTAESQHEAARRAGTDLPNNCGALGHDPSSSDNDGWLR